MIRGVFEFFRVSSQLCREQSVRISRLVDDDLTTPERLAVRTHFLTCSPCRHLAQQLHFLHRAAQKLAPRMPDPNASRMPHEVRARLERALRD
jgi:hypothetical protein